MQGKKFSALVGMAIIMTQSSVPKIVITNISQLGIDPTGCECKKRLPREDTEIVIQRSKRRFHLPGILCQPSSNHLPIVCPAICKLIV